MIINISKNFEYCFNFLKFFLIIALLSFLSCSENPSLDEISTLASKKFPQSSSPEQVTPEQINLAIDITASI